MTPPEKQAPRYTCNDYRAEMVLLGLQRQLARTDLTEQERENLRKQITEVEKQMGMD